MYIYIGVEGLDKHMCKFPSCAIYLIVTDATEESVSNCDLSSSFVFKSLWFYIVSFLLANECNWMWNATEICAVKGSLGPTCIYLRKRRHHTEQIECCCLGSCHFLDCIVLIGSWSDVELSFHAVSSSKPCNDCKNGERRACHIHTFITGLRLS